VLWRGPRSRPRVALVHRPRYDDWSLPKGKLKRGEHPVLAACREVWEETGVRPTLIARLPTVSYTTAVGGKTLPKTVDYWAMRVTADGEFVPSAETDDLVWLPVGQALRRVTYKRDIAVLTAFAALPALLAPLVVLRHASAGSRTTSPGTEDAKRRLDAAGRAQARGLADLLECFTPARLISAAPVRCVQTLEPAAHRLDLEIEIDRRFDEGSDPHAAALYLRGAVARAGATVVCSQGKAIPPMLAALTGETAEDYETPKGSGWVLSFRADANGGPSPAVVDRLT
jgi:8-oxo-dGTP pyrophosphatase MutT (NUDIX family)/phosphohistidine phosphatase SixA